MATSNFLTESVPKIREATMENSRDLNKLMVRVEIETKELEFVIGAKNYLIFLSHDIIREKMLQQHRVSDLQTDLSTCLLYLTRDDITPQDKEKKNEKCEDLVLEMNEQNVKLKDIRENLNDAITKINVAGSQVDTKQCNLINSTRILLQALTNNSIKNGEKLDEHQAHMQTMDQQHTEQFQMLSRRKKSFFFSRDCLQRENDFEI